METAEPATTCPMCGSADVSVIERVSAGVVVFACDDCGATWADRVATEPTR